MHTAKCASVQNARCVFIICEMEKPLKQKTFTCTRCGKKFVGWQDRCPRCGQLFVFEKGGKYHNALGDELVLSKDKKHIVKTIPNKKRPK